MNPPENSPPVSRPLPRRRWVKWLLGLFVGSLATTFVALRALGSMFAKHDATGLPGATDHLLVTNGFTLRWAERKAALSGGFDLVFVHGTPGSAGVWDTQFRSSLTNTSLFAYDRPGFGKSKPALARPHLQTQADVLAALLAVATTNRVLLVGHSYGSPIALLTTLEHPEKVAGVLLIGGDVDPAQEKPLWIQYLFGWRLTSWFIPGPLRQCNRELLTVRADLTAMQKQLPRLTVPVVMLHGDQDPLVPVENVAWLEQQLAAQGKSPLFAKIILPGVNHFIPWEHPADVERAVRLLDHMARANP